MEFLKELHSRWAIVGPSWAIIEPSYFPVRLFLDIDLNIKDLKRWCQIKTPWSRIWTLILLGGRLHLLRRTESLYLGRWTLWGPVLDGRPDMVRHFC